MARIPCFHCNPHARTTGRAPECPYCNGAGWISAGDDTAAAAAAARAQLPPAITRYPVAGFGIPGGLVMISEDGRMWWAAMMGRPEGMEWFEIAPLPQPAERS